MKIISSRTAEPSLLFHIATVYHHENFTYRANEGTLTLVGVASTPAASDKPGALDSGMIVIELFPESVHRLFNTDFMDMHDRIASLHDIIGVFVRDIEKRIS